MKNLICHVALVPFNISEKCDLSSSFYPPTYPETSFRLKVTRLSVLSRVAWRLNLKFLKTRGNRISLDNREVRSETVWFGSRIFFSML